MRAHVKGHKMVEAGRGQWIPQSCCAFTSESLYTMLILVTLKCIFVSRVGKLSSLQFQITKGICQNLLSSVHLYKLSRNQSQWNQNEKLANLKPVNFRFNCSQIVRGYSPLPLWNKLIGYWIIVFGKMTSEILHTTAKIRQPKPNFFRIELSSSCQVLREKHGLKKNRKTKDRNKQNATSK